MGETTDKQAQRLRRWRQQRNELLSSICVGVILGLVFAWVAIERITAAERRTIASDERP